MRGVIHRDQECAVHTGTALIETHSGTQLVCPEHRCQYYKRLVDGEWVQPSRVVIMSRIHDRDLPDAVTSGFDHVELPVAHETRKVKRKKKGR